MHALLFEVEPRVGHEQHYFDRAAVLRPLLQEHEGLLRIERFKSLARQNVILSHSHWRDEASLAKWRSDGTHYKSQVAGRNLHFRDYRLRIAHDLRFWTKDDCERSWTSQGAYADATSRPPRYVAVVAIGNDPSGVSGEAYKSVTVERSFVVVQDVLGSEDGEKVIDAARANPNATSALFALVSRDYGMFNRAEAPQYFPDIETGSEPASPSSR